MLGSQEPTYLPWIFKILLNTCLMCLGILAAMFLGPLPGYRMAWLEQFRLPAFIALSYIMVHVGLELDIKRWRLQMYVSDFVVAICLFVAPLSLTSVYFNWVLFGGDLSFSRCLLMSMFSAPTGAGMVMSMMEAADLKKTWVFNKASMIIILSEIVFFVFIAIVIPSWSAFADGGSYWGLVIATIGLLTIAWFNIHKFMIPHTWPWVLVYAFIIGTCSWLVEGFFPVGVLIPSFTLGVVIHNPSTGSSQSFKNIELELTEELIERQECIQSYAPCIEMFMGCTFMLVVGLTMPLEGHLSFRWYQAIVTNILMLLGKLLICFFYLVSKEADMKQVLALALAMSPCGYTGGTLSTMSYLLLSNKVPSSYIAIEPCSIIMNSLLSCFLMVCVKMLSPEKLRCAQ